ncbi:Uncharacterised protein [Moraxella lacunata]|uniref:Uncharacterized protein n=1 Tax=Moraxella lacunata TaxID=477 RepID=A0A378TUF4_MORLA|nr:hypothetical protein [Moraxella lacunata]STZ63512.1 Uncharacterised protein [Moraxella lacunata]
MIGDDEKPTQIQQEQEKQQDSTTTQNEPTPIAKDEQKRVYAVREKYLSEYTLEVGDDPLILPASVMAMNGKCKAYNQYGDLLNISNEQCLYMLAEKGRIPQRRDTYSRTGDSQANDVYSEYRENEFNEQKNEKQTQPQKTTQGITTTEEYIFTDKSNTEPIFN